jgi:hypothetical protein
VMQKNCDLWLVKALCHDRGRWLAAMLAKNE